MPELSLFIVTFNCACNLIQPKLFASHLLGALPPVTSRASDNGGSLPDILVLSLQEVAPLPLSFLGGRFLAPYLNNFHHAVQLASAAGQGDGSRGGHYSAIISRNVGSTAIMVFARQGCADAVKWIDVAGVGTGLWAMGNKGAVGARLGLSSLTGRIRHDEADLVEVTFVAAHLAPSERGCQRRNEDWESIARRLVFAPVEASPLRSLVNTRRSSSSRSDGEQDPLLPGGSESDAAVSQGIYRPTSYLFLAGDLNYRTNGSSPAPNAYRMYPQPTHDIADPRHHIHLLQGDQLARELQAGRTCHGLKELPIDFPPTYKYLSKPPQQSGDHQGVWNWERYRWPSWCDRILFLDIPPWSSADRRGLRFHEYTTLPITPTSDHRPVALSLSIPLEPIPQPSEDVVEEGSDPRLNPPFSLDPAWREKRVWARRREVAVGLVAYLVLTWEGNGILLALIVGCAGGWWVARGLLP
ncbi:hypothetical protein FGG08_001259 [Glutinoglossum americanum]|uniref:Inositol polyphosphate-related phosphatase domain-containing protein n=1 Tax=Glutinoglossum americanum TaxID=1670608 RepID=A0A9P8IBM1_9PEZI|nr:hypothetical protein FGG08_001259 [Glutinoglossum americanum]